MKERRPVGKDEHLYRRGYNKPEHNYMNPDGTATSRVFRLREKDNGELSVEVRSLTKPEIAIVDAKKYFLFEISNAEVCEIEGLSTHHDPIYSEDYSNDAHAVIVGMTPEDDVIPGLLARKSRRVPV
ncbi:MAG: hypothetical protein IBJ09_04710 [Bacteroidia bacterium]|nr:hypothetical protein [Bacteroidia bacterium]